MSTPTTTDRHGHPAPGRDVLVDRCVHVNPRQVRCPRQATSTWLLGDRPIAGTCDGHSKDPALLRQLVRLGASTRPGLASLPRAW